MAITGTLDGYIDENNNEYDLKDTTARTDISTINGKIPSSASSSNKLATANDIPSVTGKADKVSSATNGNFAGLDANGNLTDSGHKPSDYITSHQDISGKADKVTSATNGNFAGLDSNGNLTDSGKKSSDFATASSVTAIEGKIPSSASSSNKLATASDVNDLWSANVVSGAHNLLPFPYYEKSKTWYGVTYTVNSDGSVTLSTDANGATAQSYITFTGSNVSGVREKFLKYKHLTLTGGISNNIWLNFNNPSAGSGNNKDSGNGVSVDFTNEGGTGGTFNISLVIEKDTVITTPVTVYPLLRLTSDTDASWSSPVMTNEELSEALTVRESACTDIVEGASVSINKLIRCGNVVTLDLYLSSVTATSWSTLLAKVPIGYKPSVQTYGMGWTNDAGANYHAQFVVNITGNINLALFDLSNNEMILHLSWITKDDLPS